MRCAHHRHAPGQCSPPHTVGHPLLRPLAPAALTHRELFSLFYADLLREPLEEALAANPRPAAAHRFFAQMMRDLNTACADAMQQVCGGGGEWGSGCGAACGGPPCQGARATGSARRSACRASCTPAVSSPPRALARPLNRRSHHHHHSCLRTPTHTHTHLPLPPSPHPPPPQACYAMGYNLAIEYLADYEKTWMLDSFRALDARVLAPAGRPLTEWVFLEVRARGGGGGGSSSSSSGGGGPRGAASAGAAYAPARRASQRSPPALPSRLP